ncbi:hypothetical protein Z051_15070 [Rhodococcus rhodochrous KG-21]|uniref:Uncharacterized protein n=1 Tax=Rhodococcus rhodochrous KG-21 TaxID=1441923 RepID=A0A0M8PNN5_RHORH|nr:hypothetical protein Z051_15070 [Rhodococcus rhodochrous KG-21]
MVVPDGQWITAGRPTHRQLSLPSMTVARSDAVPVAGLRGLLVDQIVGHEPGRVAEAADRDDLPYRPGRRASMNAIDGSSS